MSHAVVVPSPNRPSRILLSATYEPLAELGERSRRRGFVHWATLALVWITFASSGVVFSEPAPVDTLSMMLVVLLPLLGLTRITPMLLLYLALWLVVGAAHLFAAQFAVDEPVALRFSLVSLYLYLVSFVLAAFIAQRPNERFSLIMNGWVFAAVVAATAGLAGYFGLIPGAELFTRYGRLAGTFKDPNVFGPFVVVPILYMLYLAIYRRIGVAIVSLGLCAFLALGLLLSFSRGAWMHLIISVLAYVYLAFVTITASQQRGRLIAMLFLGIFVSVCVLAVAVQLESVATLLAERASLGQTYDLGPHGRFGGHRVAAALVTENPMGLGAVSFSGIHHSEDVHNVYLSMALNAGWIGGGVYLVLVLLTLGLGFRHILRNGETRPIFLVLYAAFLGTAIEGLIIDTDHWRSFYILMGLCWGVMSAPSYQTAKTTVQKFARRARIVVAG